MTSDSNGTQSMAVAATKLDPAVSTKNYRATPATILAVIPTLNEAEHIETCIRSLMTGQPSLRSVPLLVVDGGSTDATVEIVESLRTEFDNLRLLHNPKRLQAAALNLAAEADIAGDAQWLVRCDAHALYPENYILRIADALIETRAESIVVAMDSVGQSCFEKANAWVVDTPLGSGGAAHRGGQRSGYVDHGHHAGFAIEEFRRLGGYDETFSHNEDAEYDTRLVAQNGRIFLDAETRVRYIPRGSIWRLSKQYFAYGAGRARNAAKHRSPLKIRQLLPVFATLASLFGILVAPFFTPALILPLGYFGVLAATSLWVAIKHKSACGMLAGVAAGTMHMSWATGFLNQTVRHQFARLAHPNAARAQPRRDYARAPIIPALGRSVLNLFTPLMGRNSIRGPKNAANENYRIHRPVTRVTEAPEGECIYAIGDIHGRFDLLESLIEKIEEDTSRLPEGTISTIVFLGDYIDRGLQSRQVIDYFLSERLSQFETVYLMGNHEEALLNFLQDPHFGEKWAIYGGSETLFSYGLQPPLRGSLSNDGGTNTDAWMTLWHKFRASLPDPHLKFFQTLKLSHTIGDYVFVHAGLRPGIPISQQSGDDMLWIREEFLVASGDFEKLVVHGHTPSDHVYRDNRRVGLDTGAYMTGRLTAGRFFGTNIDYLST